MNELPVISMISIMGYNVLNKILVFLNFAFLYLFSQKRKSLVNFKHLKCFEFQMMTSKSRVCNCLGLVFPTQNSFTSVNELQKEKKKVTSKDSLA